MLLPPLTHHQILRLVEPFTRRGWRVDLPASDRMARRLLFKPVVHAGQGIDGGDLCETLSLQGQDDGNFTLTRSLALGSGLVAGAATEGADPAILLQRLEGFAPQRQFSAEAGFVMAMSHALEPAQEGVRAVLSRAEARLDDSREPGSHQPRTGDDGPSGKQQDAQPAATRPVTLKLRVPMQPSVPADIDLACAASDFIAWPDDLLAVLGRDWSLLERHREGWGGRLQLRSKPAERSDDAQSKWLRTVRHLAQTLAEPPAQFHHRHRRARWGVALRRAVPLFTCVALMGGAAAVPSFGLGQDSVLRMLIFHAPPLLLMLGICMREMPRIEWPRRPRASPAVAWCTGAAAPLLPHVTGTIPCTATR